MSLRVSIRLLAAGLGIGLLGLRLAPLDPSSVLLAGIGIAALIVCGWQPARLRSPR